MLDHAEWKARAVATGATLCPACESTDITCGACARWRPDDPSRIRLRSVPTRVFWLFALIDYYDDSRREPDRPGLKPGEFDV
ncbi:hypothetical protein LMG19282_03121 [Cupriavidus campinensis]|uniref:hypothetical protein n=1 Tax=Cupriavidus campinensis TaxID=151783 RepID=UPI001B236ED5|nr:hypothetical protein [Cupriavidus campinensis]CAG2147282.1 hypothetical protein LMG19282_03121 [Cupriavidus campinensis]